MTDLARPQPLGALPLPAGFLVVPADPAFDEARGALLEGRSPARWPDGLGFYERALAGDLDGALAEVRGHDAAARVNRLVLAPDAAGLAACRADGAPWDAIAGVVAYAVGLVEEPPSADGLDGELRAHVLAAHAAACVEEGDLDDAILAIDHGLEAAGNLPGLVGQLLATRADLVASRDGATEAAIAGWQAALEALGRTGLEEVRAEGQLALGRLLQESSEGRRERLVEAVRCYQAALSVLTRERAPEAFAAANANLGVAYLQMPMTDASDGLRMGVAVQSLRAALSVYTPEAYPAEWASAQLNLANALVYLPSSHVEDNLAEAVRLYDELLERRDRAQDPVGYARVCANLGNALAHLGIFDQATARLQEARMIFDQQGETEAVMAVREILDEIARTGTLAATRDVEGG